MSNLSEKGASNKLQKVISAARGAFITVAFFSFLINLLMLAFPIYMLQIFDRVLVGNTYDTLFYLTAITLIAIGIQCFFQWVRSGILITISTWFDELLSKDAFGKTFDFVIEKRVKDSQILNDILQVRQFICGNGLVALFDAPWIVIYIFVTFLLHPLYGYLSLGSSVIITILGIMTEYTSYTPLRESSKYNLDASRFANAATKNTDIIMGMGMGNTVVNVWNNLNCLSIDWQNFASSKVNVYSNWVKFIRLASQVLAYTVGAYLIINKEVAAGSMVAASILMARALAPIDTAVAMSRQVVSSFSSYQRVKQFFAYPVLRGEALELPPPKGHIAFENVSFYFAPGMPPLLQQINFELEPGDSLGIIGASGAGKSTLSRLLLGVMRPSTGTVRIDGADAYFWDRKNFGQYVGYMPQNVELFSGTIKANIARLGELDPELIVKAAERAGAHETILKFPLGYETEVVENGVNLAFGQKQLIGLSRAMLHDPSVVVLDEPDAHLDQDGVASLWRLLQDLRQRKKTTIMITHRQQLIDQMGKLLFMQGGRVAMFGPKDEVLARIRALTQGQV